MAAYFVQSCLNVLTRFWMGGGLENRCVGRVYGADGAVRLYNT